MHYRAFLHCDGIDVSFRVNCSATQFSLNATDHIPLRIGDSAIAVGYVAMDKPFSWSGSLGGSFASIHTALPKATNVHNLAYFHNDEYIIQGVIQLPGMSGGPVANGKGLTGLVHIRGTDTLAVAGVVPLDYIKKCIRTKLGNSSPQITCPADDTIVSISIFAQQ